MSIKKLSLILVAAVVTSGPALAITAAQRQAINYDAVWYSQGSGGDCANLGVGDGATGPVGSQSGSWNSGLQPPYILQEFMIEVLKDIAAKMGKPASSAVTKEHVLALVSFGKREGGNLTNTSGIFNPLNTGAAPDLVAGPTSGEGKQAFRSFDAGVEGTARGLTDSNHTRLSAVLTDPNSTANQFMYALTYYQKYPGNAIWAAASAPPNQDSYYQSVLGSVSYTRAHYANIASYVIGTPVEAEYANLTDTSKLDNSLFPDGSSTTATPSNDISNGGSGGNSCPQPVSTTTTTPPITKGPVYIVGDSLSVGTQNVGLDKTLTAAGWPATIKGAVGRSITGKGQAGEPSASDEVDADQTLVKSAHVVVVILGSNPENNFQTSQTALIQKIKGYNPNVSIFWMNVAGTKLAQQYSDTNTTIARQAPLLGYQVIDWFHVMYPSGKPTSIDPGLTSALMSGNQPHPTTAGYQAMAKLIADSITGAAQ